MGDEEDRIEFLGQVAAWYYEDNLDQSEIAKRIGKSRSMVSRLLAEARETGLVEIRVRLPLRTEPRLEEGLVEHFGLSEARVLKAGDADVQSMLRKLGRLASRSIQPRLRSGIGVAIGWGAALFHTVRAIPEIKLDDVTVLQVMGSVGDGDPNVDGADLARTLATKLNGDFRSLAAPLIVDRGEVAASLFRERSIRATLRFAEDAELAITGVGSIHSAHSGLVRAGYLDKDYSDALHEIGVVGDLMGYFLDREGHVMDIPANDRVVALHPERLKLIPTVVAIAGGVDKAAAIGAMLAGGYADVLITDDSAARAILSDAEQRELVSS